MAEETDKSLIESIKKLAKMVEGLQSRKYLQMVEKPRRFLFYNFISGGASGVGTAIGATIAFGLVLWILSKLQVVPILGEWVVRVIDYIQNTRGY